MKSSIIFTFILATICLVKAKETNFIFRLANNYDKEIKGAFSIEAYGLEKTEKVVFDNVILKKGFQTIEKKTDFSIDDVHQIVVTWNPDFDYQVDVFYLFKKNKTSAQYFVTKTGRESKLKKGDSESFFKFSS